MNGFDSKDIALGICIAGDKAKRSGGSGNSGCGCLPVIIGIVVVLVLLKACG